MRASPRTAPGRALSAIREQEASLKSTGLLTRKSQSMGRRIVGKWCDLVNLTGTAALHEKNPFYIPLPHLHHSPARAIYRNKASHPT